ncbi:MAG: lysophospholipid acyltransferase family protein [bacterium]|nr:lysophospholipid acyltransferase family protein [Betaproteobacteria bacterium]
MHFLIRLLGRMPLRVLHWLGAGLGWIAYAADRTYRGRLSENLARSGLATGHTAAPGGLGRVRRRAIAEAGRTIAELPAFWLRPQAALARWVRVTVGQQHLDEAHARGRGILFLTPHLGAFEITPQWYGLARPITVMYRRPKLAWLDPIVRAGRGRGQVSLVGADLGGVRAMLRALRAGQAAGLLPDQAPGAGEGVWADFFGRPAYTITLAARLAKSTGATVLMAVGRRLPAARGYELEFHPLPDPLPEDPQQAARAVNAAVEAVVARCPEQYLWSYNRYKQPAGAPPPPPLSTASPPPPGGA